MGYTLGGATTDDISFSASLGLGGSGAAHFVAGVWMPTTLTATRGYWGASSLIGMRVATTTSEMNFVSNNATTPGQWETSGAGIAINNEYYIAWLLTHLNGATGAMRCWVGTPSAYPAEVTVTQTVAPVGNFTGNSNRTVGSMAPSVSVAWQGDVGWATFYSQSAVGNATPLGIATAGAITNDEADYVFRRLVMPLYLGNPDPRAFFAISAGQFCLSHLPLDGGKVAYQASHDPAVSPTPELTINATFTQRSAFRSPPPTWPIQPPYPRLAA